MNETTGRNSEYEPSPYVSIDKVFCFWKNARISKDEAKNIYTPHNKECQDCEDCQK